MKKCINLPNMSKAGRYSHAVEAGGFIFVSGNVAVDIETGEKITGDIPRATELILKNIGAILKEAGSDLSKVVKTTVFLTDMGKFGEMNEAYKKIFVDNPPARSCVGVRELPAGFDIEIEAIALK
jgi:2-iminobutanoate/2-iminopropanoate deaminase